jgi:hypothetical protein
MASWEVMNKPVYRWVWRYMATYVSGLLKSRVQFSNTDKLIAQTMINEEPMKIPAGSIVVDNSFRAFKTSNFCTTNI